MPPQELSPLASSTLVTSHDLHLDPDQVPPPGTYHQDWADYRKLTAKQRMALELCISQPHAKVLYGGSGFSGKSYLLRSAAVYFAGLFSALGFPGQLGMLVCKDYPSLKGRHVANLIHELGVLGEFKQDDGVYGMCFKFHDPNLGVLLLRNLDDPDKFRGWEVSYVLIDELTELGPETLPGLMYCLRSRHNLPFLPILAGSNPDGLGYGWVKKLWVDRDFSNENYDPQDFHFIQALVTDNPNLDANAYMQTLSGLPDHIRKARLEGSWDAPAGARWPQLEPHIHQFRTRDLFKHGIPPDARLIMGVDWGIRAPYCALWILEQDRAFYVLREDYQRDLPSEQQAKRIVHLTKAQEQVLSVYCDSQMWERKRDPHRNLRAGESAGDVYTQILREDGRFRAIQPAYKGPRQAPLDTLDRLFNRNNGFPDLYIEHGCTELWRELTGAVWDTREGLQKREDISPQCPDHAITALYYALHTHLHGSYKPATSLSTAQPKESWLRAVEQEEEAYLREIVVRGGRRGHY